MVMAQLDKSGTGCIHLLEKRQHDMLWGIVIPFTKQSESIDPEAYQNTSVVSWFFLVPLELKQESMDHQIPAGDNMWTAWYLNFFRANSSNCNQSHFVGLRFAPTFRYPPSLVVGRMKGGFVLQQPNSGFSLARWPSRPSDHCMNCTKSLESKINSCKTWSRKSQTRPWCCWGRN